MSSGALSTISSLALLLTTLTLLYIRRTFDHNLWLLRARATRLSCPALKRPNYASICCRTLKSCNADDKGRLNSPSNPNQTRRLRQQLRNEP